MSPIPSENPGQRPDDSEKSKESAGKKLRDRRAFLAEILGLGGSAAVGAGLIGYLLSDDKKEEAAKEGKALEDAGTTEKEAGLSPRERRKLEIEQAGLMYDPVTENGFQPNSGLWKRIVSNPKTIEKMGALRQVMDAEGKPMLDKYKRPVKLRNSVAVRIEKADQLMFAATGKHLQIGWAFRTNEEQADIKKRLGEDRKKAGKNPWQAAPKGMSYHEAGLAVDVHNWIEAQKYLAMAGMKGGMFTDFSIPKERRQSDGSYKLEKVKFRNVDPGHFSRGEFSNDIKPADWDKCMDDPLNCGSDILDAATLSKRMLEYRAHNKKWDESESYESVKGYLAKHYKNLKAVVDLGKVVEKLKKVGFSTNGAMKKIKTMGADAGVKAYDKWKEWDIDGGDLLDFIK